MKHRLFKIRPGTYQYRGHTIKTEDSNGDWRAEISGGLQIEPSETEQSALERSMSAIDSEMTEPSW